MAKSSLASRPRSVGRRCAAATLPKFGERGARAQLKTRIRCLLTTELDTLIQRSDALQSGHHRLRVRLEGKGSCCVAGRPVAHRIAPI